MKRFDLMHQINARGTFVVSKWAIPYLEKAANPHILMLSPPLDMKEKWFAPHTAYSMAKFGMSLVVLGLAGELRPKGHCGQCAVAAHHHRHRGGAKSARRRRDDAPGAQARDHGRRGLCDFLHSRRANSPDAFSSTIFSWPNAASTDFDHYRVDPAQPLAPDFFVPDDIPPPTGVAIRRPIEKPRRALGPPVTYRAPLADIGFALKYGAALDVRDRAKACSAISRFDDVDAVLAEAGRFAGEVIAPLNRVGDTFGTPFKDGVVTTAPGWKEAYRGWRTAAGTAVAAPTRMGRPGAAADRQRRLHRDVACGLDRVSPTGRC